MQEADNCLYRFEFYQVLTSDTKDSAKLELNSLKDFMYLYIGFQGGLGGDNSMTRKAPNPRSEKTPFLF